MTGLSKLNDALVRVPKRAESNPIRVLRETFVDSGIASALGVIDNQVLYGRRGTGKTHALRYLESSRSAKGDLVVYVDLRTIGSAQGVFRDETDQVQQVARLLIDLMENVHSALLTYVLEDSELIEDVKLVSGLDALYEALGDVVKIETSQEVTCKEDSNSSSNRRASVALNLSANPGLRGSGSKGSQQQLNSSSTIVTSSSVRPSLNFSSIAEALRTIAGRWPDNRIWILLDEWSSVPKSSQPLLGAFLARCLLPLPNFTVKIAAIELQSRFRERRADGQLIGLELGADVSANLDLDDFMVFEQNEDSARDFFRNLITKHVNAVVSADEGPPQWLDESELVSKGFSDTRALDELIRAAEGVPRDAINIAAKSAMSARDSKITVPQVRKSAQAWFQSDKQAALRAQPEAEKLLQWVVDRVIKDKRARGFLLNQKDSQNSQILALLDARVLHRVRKGYSAQDVPGVRFDVYLIDYGTYVDLIHTKYAPQGTFAVGNDGDSFAHVVPSTDLRSLRRAILDLEEFEGADSTPSA